MELAMGFSKILRAPFKNKESRSQQEGLLRLLKTQERRALLAHLLQLQEV